MIKYGELDQALATFICVDTHDVIPAEYYRRVIKAAIRANNEGKQWDMLQTAEVLLFFAFHDGLLAPSQLTGDGLKALDHAEAFLTKTEKATGQAPLKHRHSA